MSFGLRPYQVGGIDRVRARLAEIQRVVLVLPTGGGKTVVAGSIVESALKLGTHTLFLAHRREIIRQSFCKMIRSGIPVAEVGVVLAGVPSTPSEDMFPQDLASLDDTQLWHRFGRRRPAARVQVASLDSIRTRARPRAELIIIDEAHRALAASYLKFLESYPDAAVLGLTATPYRADGRGLGDLFEDLVVVASPRQLIDEGFLVEPEVWTVPVGARPDLSGVKITRGDYVPGELAAAVDRAELVGDIVEHWKRHAEGVRTVAFACSVEHSRHIARRFLEAGVPAEHLDGNTPNDQRDATLSRLARGETLVVSNCALLTEGWDCPPVKCCILARPTKSLCLVMQCAGRILRPWEGQRAIILDHAGCMLEHGLPQDDREFSLEGDPKGEKLGGAAARECPKCGFVVPPAAPQCAACGFVFPPSPAGTPPEEIPGQLVNAHAAKGELDLALLASLEAEWRKKNAKRVTPMKSGWILYRFKEKTGRRPPRGYKLPSLAPEQLAARAKFEALRDKGLAPSVAHAALARLQDVVAGPGVSAEGLDSLRPAAEPPAPAAPVPVSPPPSEGPKEEVVAPKAAPRAPWDRPDRKKPARSGLPAAPVPAELEEVAF